MGEMGTQTIPIGLAQFFTRNNTSSAEGQLLCKGSSGESSQKKEPSTLFYRDSTQR